MLLLIDNYDSFVHNLARYFERLGQRTLVVRNDAIDTAQIRQLAAQAIVLSPGPCAPQQAGCSLDVVRQLHDVVPILGICLGHQTIAAALGGQVVRSPHPMHGRASEVFHTGHPIFAGVASPFAAGRYHSLIADEPSLPDSLEVIARASDGLVMGIAHRALPVVGLQFHPESILTAAGYRLLKNFLRIAGLPTGAENENLFEAERRLPPQWRLPTHDHAVTF